MENNTRTEKIMESLAGLQKTAASDFFYTRLTARMQKEAEPVNKSFFILRPAFVTTALSVVFIINIFSLTQFNNQPKQKEAIQSNKPATIESFAEAYGMNTTSVYE